MDTRSITIREDQSKWLEKSPLNFSKFIRLKLDEEMEKGELSLGGSLPAQPD